MTLLSAPAPRRRASRGGGRARGAARARRLRARPEVVPGEHHVTERRAVLPTAAMPASAAARARNGRRSTTSTRTATVRKLTVRRTASSAPSTSTEAKSPCAPALRISWRSAKSSPHERHGAAGLATSVSLRHEPRRKKPVWEVCRRRRFNPTRTCANVAVIEAPASRAPASVDARRASRLLHVRLVCTEIEQTGHEPVLGRRPPAEGQVATCCHELSSARRARRPQRRGVKAQHNCSVTDANIAATPPRASRAAPWRPPPPRPRPPPPSRSPPPSPACGCRRRR